MSVANIPTLLHPLDLLWPRFLQWDHDGDDDDIKDNEDSNSSDKYDCDDNDAQTFEKLQALKVSAQANSDEKVLKLLSNLYS